MMYKFQVIEKCFTKRYKIFILVSKTIWVKNRLLIYMDSFLRSKIKINKNTQANQLSRNH